MAAVATLPAHLLRYWIQDRLDRLGVKDRHGSEPPLDLSLTRHTVVGELVNQLSGGSELDLIKF